MSWLALDIGGANLKAADGQGWARSEPFALWQNPTDLTAALTALLDAAPAAQHVAITMTGELCDCFATKADGVRHIVSAAETAVRGRELRVYLLNSRLVSSDEARELPQLAAASNWHALASFVARELAPGSGVLLDIGSTTTDIVPLFNGESRAVGLTDTERLIAGELVYTGVGRSPVCAVTHSLPWRGQVVPVAAELFATTSDAYLVLGHLSDRPDVLSSADGRPLTTEFARARLARMICADTTEFTADDAVAAARAIQDAQQSSIRRSLSQVVEQMPAPPKCFVTSGAGEFLAAQVVAELGTGSKVLSLSRALGAEVSASAPAHALAVLARRRHSQLPA